MIFIKSESELQKIRHTGSIVAQTLEHLKKKVTPGITTRELDEEAKKVIESLGGKSAFLGYRGYPAHICASINEEVVHGIPDGRVLRTGDIISLDVGVECQGYFGDAAITLGIGKINSKARQLINITREALYKAIEAAKDGNHLSDISYTVQKHAETAGFSVVREFVGHGIGSSLHEEPQIPNFGGPGSGVILKTGMVLAIEPMINEGVWKVEIRSNDWTAVTKDRKLSAHFEHTVCITGDKAEILTV